MTRTTTSRFAEGREPLGDDDLAAIRGLHDRWIDAEVAGEVDRILDLCTEDIRFMGPDATTVEGRDAVRDFLSRPAPRVRSIETTPPRIEGNRELAYKTCRFLTTYVADNGGPSRAEGTHMWILRKEKDGWKVAFVTWQTRTRRAGGDRP